jgi:hypothetical protein
MNLSKRVEKLERARPETATEGCHPAVMAIIDRIREYGKGDDKPSAPHPEVTYEDLSAEERDFVDRNGCSPLIARLINVAAGRAEWPTKSGN